MVLTRKIAFVSEIVLNEVELKDWIGDTSIDVQQGQHPIGHIATKQDPICRFMYVQSLREVFFRRS